jgi:NADPH-dependent 7-cyano-7-deazaguanine reductase QueF
MAISTTGSNYDPAALLPLYSKDMAYELAAAGAIFESLELSIDLLGADRSIVNRRLNSPVSQIVVVSASMPARFQYLDQVDAWKQSYVKAAKNSSVMIALFQKLSAGTGLDITWASSVEASLFDVSVTLPPTLAATINCPAADSASFFESNVVVSFAGNPDNVTSDQLLAVEQAFLESYNSANSLSSGICDTLFRVLTNVSIDVDGSYSSSRRLQQQVTTKKKFTFRFRVIGSCRYCAKSTNLFYNDALRRTLLVAEDESLPRALQISSSSSPSDDCVCPVNTTERSPTVDEFFTIFNSSVSELQEAGTLTFIESIVGAPTEIDPVECSAEVNSFETEVALEVSGNPDAITGNEKRSLEAAFETTYNTLLKQLYSRYLIWMPTRQSYR